MIKSTALHSEVLRFHTIEFPSAFMEAWDSLFRSLLRDYIAAQIPYRPH